MTADLDRAHYHLTGWGAWRRANQGECGHGFDSHSTILESGNSKHFDHMVEAEDSRIAAICDTIIDELAYLYKTVLESEYVLQGVIKHKRMMTDDLLRDAQAEFWSRAKRWMV